MSGALAVAFSGTGAQVLVVVLVVAAVFTLALTLLLVFARPNASIEDRLDDYEISGAGPATGAHGGKPASIAESRIVQEAVGLTSRLAERAGLLTRVDRILEQADLPLRSAEALFFYGAGVVILVFLALFLAPSAAVALVLSAIVATVPVALVLVRRQRRVRAFEESLPDALTLLAGSMRAGFSLVQGLSTVADESVEPMKSELLRAVNENRLGRPIEDALDEVAVRMDSADLAWAVVAIGIQREVGGNLSQLLDTVAETMVQRERVRREIRSLTAEGRLSGLILGLFPPAFALVLWLLRPSYMQLLFKDSTGQLAIGVAVVLTAVGFVWLRKILEIEV